MTIREFFESKNHLAIHCNTIEKAIKLLKAFDDNGYTWRDNTKYTKEMCYNDYTEDTCYSNDFGYCYAQWYSCNDYIILEFEAIEEIEQPKLDLSQVSTEDLLEEIKRRIKVNNNDNN